jgi:DNA-binding beta-propeller fold protein YncE
MKSIRLLLVMAVLAFGAAPAQAATYSLGTTNLVVGPAAGTNDVILAVTPQTGTWTASTNATWLHLTVASQTGTGNARVVFSYDASPGATRTGTLTIAGLTFTVIQAGSTFVAAGLVPNLVTNVLNPFGVTVDGAGNIYVAETFRSQIVKWTAASNTETILPIPGLQEPWGLAVDGAGNLYVADADNSDLVKWTAASGAVSNLVTGLAEPRGVAVDGAGNVYIADTGNYQVKKWTAASGTVNVLTGASDPVSVAVDGSGNVYFTDNEYEIDYRAYEWMAANSNTTTLVSSPSEPPTGVAVDGAENVYIAENGYNVTEWQYGGDTTVLLSPTLSLCVAVDGAGNLFFGNYIHSAVDELPHAFLDASSKVEGIAAGSDALPGVLPATASLSGPLAPVSDSSWLTITSTNGGVVSFSFTANTGPVRTANIALLGQTIPVTQAGSTYTLGTTNLLEGPSPGSAGISLTVNPNSGTWTASTNDTWLHLSPANQGGTGSATVVFSFDANPGATRTSAIIIEGMTVTVTQAGSTYVATGMENAFVDPTPRTESAAAGSDALPVVLPATVNLSGPFTPTSDESWLTITSTNNGVVSFSFLANTGSSRTAHITLLGQSVAVNQGAPSFNLGTAARLEGPAAGSDSVVLAVIPNIATWTAGTNATWLHLNPANQSGTGSTNVIFSYDANPGATRTGTLAIAGQLLTVTQGGSTYVATGPAGLVTNLVTGLSNPRGVAVDGSGNVYFIESGELMEWTAASGNLSYLACCFDNSSGLAVDGAGNVYVADAGNNAIEECLAMGGVNTLVTGLNNPTGVAVDGAGNVYFSDTGNAAIKEWTAANNSVIVLANTGLISPTGVAVDAAGNVYFADSSANAVYEWTAANSSVTTLVPPAWGLNGPAGVAVDGAGNVYIADTDNDAIEEWTAANSTVTTLAPPASGLIFPTGVAVDGAGNIYIADTDNNTIDELPYAFVDPTPKLESAAGGSDSLPVVLPATANLSGPFAPASDQPWLAITDTNNGVVSFTFSANTTAGSPTAQITLIGQVITVTQNGPYSLSTTTRLEGPAAGSDSVILLVNPNYPDWTNLANADWLHLGPASQTGSGSMNVAFSYDANPGLTRTGTVTIAGLTLNVIQAASTYVPANPLTTLATGLNQPEGVAVDVAGNVYIADTGNNAIEEWTAASDAVTTLVSSGLSNPGGVAVDGAGNVYIADTYNDAIEEWTPINNTVTTLVSGNLSQPQGVAVDGTGNVYIADTYDNAVKEWTVADNNLSTLVSSGLSSPSGVAVDVAGNVYISDTYNYAIEEWTAANSNLNTLVSGVYLPRGVAVDLAGNVDIAEPYSYEIEAWSAANNSLSTVVSSGLNQPSGVAVDNAGNVYIADTYNNAVEEVPYAFVDPSPLYENPAAGSDVLPMVLPATANLTGPFTPTSDSPWLIITGTANGTVSCSFTANNGPTRTANITLLGQTISVTQSSPNTYSVGAAARQEGPTAGSDSIVLAVSPNTGLWTATNEYATWLHFNPANQGGTGSTNVVFCYDANPGPTRAGYLNIAGNWIYINQAGSTYVAADPMTTLVSSGVAGPAGAAVDNAGNVYTADTANNAIKEWMVANNTETTLVSAGLNHPTGVAVDGAGNVFIADTGNNAVKEWLAGNSTVITNVSAGLNAPAGVAVDRAGDVYIADAGDNAVKEWPPGGPLNTLVSSGLSNPRGVAVDGAGNVYIADTGNNAIKEWNAASSNVTALVSTGLNHPAGVAMDGAGNVYIADSTNNAIKKWTAASNSVTSLVTSGLASPAGVAVDGAGNVYIADTGDNLIKEVPDAFVDPTTRLESGASGVDALPVVLPATENLGAPFTPASDESWLTFSGINSGVVSFAFLANTGSGRTAHITLLGQSIAVTQSAPSYSLGTYARLEGPAAGSDSVVLAVIPNIATWTATTNATWLHLNPANQSGTGSTNVIFSYDANPGVTRAGTLTVEGMTVTVTQAGSTYVAADWLTNLVSAGLSDPTGVAVDGAGDVYFANSGSYGVYEWTVANHIATDLYGLYYPSGVAMDGTSNVVFADSAYNGIFDMTVGNNPFSVSEFLYNFLSQPSGVAVDHAGNVYIADTGDAVIREWLVASGSLTTLVNSGLISPTGVAVDAAGNVYIADSGTNVLYKWTLANGSATTLVSGLANATGVAVDGAGNVFIADTGHNAIKKWTAANNSVTTLVSSGLNGPTGVAVDGTGNVYFTDSGNNVIKELTYAFVDPTSKSESGNAGNDALPVVLPAVENLAVPFAPASDQSWLTITGATNGVVYFACQANAGSVRTAHISVLGQNTAVIQAVTDTSPILTGWKILPNGTFQFSFSGNPGGSFAVLSTTNLSLPVINWTVIGPALNLGSGLFQFTGPPVTNYPQQFFRVRSL